MSGHTHCSLVYTYLMLHEHGVLCPHSPIWGEQCTSLLEVGAAAEAADWELLKFSSNSAISAVSSARAILAACTSVSSSTSANICITSQPQHIVTQTECKRGKFQT